MNENMGAMKPRTTTDSGFDIDLKGVEKLDSDRYYILVRPENGLWATVDTSHSDLIEAISDGITYEEFEQKFPDKLDLLKILFVRGIVRINGNAYFKDRYLEHCNIWPEYPSLMVVKYIRGCNLRCSYCYDNYPDSDTTMTNDLVIHIVKRMINTYGDNQYLLALHGGEPTLRFKDIVALTQQIKQISSKILLSIQTNATLVTKPMAEFFAHEKFAVGVSVDGFDEPTNSNRLQANGQSSLHLSMRGLENLLAAGVSPGIISVVTPANQHRLLQHFDYYTNLGIKEFAFNPFFPAGRGENFHYEMDIDLLVDTNIELIKKINDTNIQIPNRADYVTERNVWGVVSNLTTMERDSTCGLHGCGAGRVLLAFDVEGSIYPCDDFISDKTLCLGNATSMDNFKEAVVRMHTEGVIKYDVDLIDACNACIWKRICTLHCASNSYFFSGHFDRPHSMCSYMKKLLPRVIDLLHRHRIDPKYFIPC